MRDTLPKQISNRVERGVLNLDVSKSNGIQWVCYCKNNEKCCYSDWDDAKNCELIGVDG